MNRMRPYPTALFAALGLAAVVGSITIAQPSKESKPEGQKEMKLPPGWTEEDMKACMEAGTPGKMHEHLARGVGAWRGKATMWMAPGADPVTNQSTASVTPILDGRFTRWEYKGEMPGAGPYSGYGIQGFDNVSQKFVSVWLDNYGTGIMNGTGEISPDGKSITWTYTYNCPINHRPTTMREIETTTGDNTKTLEMFGIEPKSGKEYKMMNIELTRSAGGAQ